MSQLTDDDINYLDATASIIRESLLSEMKIDKDFSWLDHKNDKGENYFSLVWHSKGGSYSEESAVYVLKMGTAVQLKEAMNMTYLTLLAISNQGDNPERSVAPDAS